MNLEYIVDSIESLVLPVNPRAAFELLMAMFEADSVAMENCGEHDYEVTCAFERAAELIAEAARALPREEVEEKIQSLMAGDGYGVMWCWPAQGALIGSTGWPVAAARGRPHGRSTTLAS